MPNATRSNTTDTETTGGSLRETDLSGKHIHECVASLPGWLREAADDAALEARMFACVAERLATRFVDLDMCLSEAMWDRGGNTFDGGKLLLAVGAEIGLKTVDECLMGAMAIITNATGCTPGDDAAARATALKHAYEHRAEEGEPLLLRSLTELYTRTQAAREG